MSNDQKNLENIIQENKEKFDFHQPPQNLWQNIESQLPKPEKKIINLNWLSLISVAASFFVIGIVGANYFISKRSDPQIEQIEMFYGNTFNVKLNQLAKNQLLNDELIQQLKELDALEIELKNEILKNYGDDRQMMIKRLLDHYKTKIRLIELINEKSSYKSQIDI